MAVATKAAVEAPELYLAENTPNAARMIESLRHLDYDNISAILDLVDNCWDAAAQNVRLVVDHDKAGQWIVAIADDGTGMDRDTLDQALRLGSLSERDERVDLGKFGMAAVTATLAIGKRTTVFTHAPGSAPLASVSDLTVIAAANKFVKRLGEATPAEGERFASFYPDKAIPEHGTVLIVEDCDNVRQKSRKTFIDTVRNRLGETYRSFLSAGRKIYLNDEEVPIVDPLMLDGGGRIYSDETYDIEVGENGDAVRDQIRIRIAILPDFAEGKAHARGIYAKHQGIYVMRNNRQIAAAQTFGWQRHNQYNRIRGEMYFTGTLDNAMGVRFTKQGVNPIQAIEDKIRSAYSHQQQTISTDLDAKKKVTDPDKAAEAHGEAAEHIKRKGHLLVPVKPSAETPSKNGTTGTKTGKDKQETGKEKTKTGKTPRVLMDCEFERVSMGPQGLIFGWGVRGKTVLVKWNVDHPFYENVLLKHSGDKDIVSGIDYLAYSLAAALVNMEDEDKQSILESVMTITATNLRVLLS